MNQIRFAALAACLAAIVTSHSAAAAAPATVTYTITDLGSLGGTSTIPAGINGYGQVTGVSNSQAFLWTPTVPGGTSGAMIDLGVGGTFSQGSSINASGQVAGGSDNRAFLWKPTTPNGTSGTTANLGMPGELSSFGSGVNDYGQVAGTFITPSASLRSFLWRPSTPNGTTGSRIDLGTLGGTVTSGGAINASGAVTGASTLSGVNELRAFLWKPLSPNGLVGTMYNLGVAGEAKGINASGQVTGYYYDANSFTHAFLWTPTVPGGTSGTSIDLGVGSFAHGINAGGQVVGYSGFGAFRYQIGSGMEDLNSLIDPLSGWELLDANAINDRGQIVGQGQINGEYRAFLLTPIPEPSAAALVACGVIGLIAFRRGQPCSRHNSAETS